MGDKAWQRELSVNFAVYTTSRSGRELYTLKRSKLSRRMQNRLRIVTHHLDDWQPHIPYNSPCTSAFLCPAGFAATSNCGCGCVPSPCGIWGILCIGLRSVRPSTGAMAMWSIIFGRVLVHFGSIFGPDSHERCYARGSNNWPVVSINRNQIVISRCRLPMRFNPPLQFRGAGMVAVDFPKDGYCGFIILCR